jgi:hypothetical protein
MVRVRVRVTCTKLLRQLYRYSLRYIECRSVMIHPPHANHTSTPASPSHS